ncbi:Tail sheath protein [Erwinia amylovora Ea644]|nr:Tail sheath protein [Erwinia amylovora Ea644]
MVAFTRVPDQLRTPLFFVEFDNSRANTASALQRTLIIGQQLDSASAAAGIPQRVSSDRVSAVRAACCTA